MPRKYTRQKLNVNSYTLETLQKAMDAIRNEGRKIREVGRSFKIPESTLRKQLQQNQPQPPRLGRKAVFSNEVESDLKEYVLTLAKLFYGLTPKSLRRLAFKFAEEKKIPHHFNKEQALAGKDWLYGFLRRNPEVGLRQPEGTSINRIASFNAEETSLFYSNLQQMMEKFKFEANKIFNMDETGITTVQKKCPKVYGPKGAKKVGAAISAERGRTITVVCCMSAAGNYIPPMLIYPRKRMNPLLQRNGPIGACYACSNNGWINSELFLEWLAHFQKYTKSSENDPILLILDNHSSHISIEAYEFCKQNHINMVSLPPHTSNHLQPLDLTFFSPLKNALYREYNLYLTSTGHEKITEYDLAELLNKSYMKVSTMEKAVSGFRTAGIFPLNPERFNEDDFAPANNLIGLHVNVVSSPEPGTPNSATALSREETELLLRASSPNEQPFLTPVQEHQPSTSNAQDPQPSTSKAQDPQPAKSKIQDPQPATSKAQDHQPTSKAQDPLPSTSKANSFFTVAPIPKKVNNPTKSTANRREKMHSEILTSTPLKQKLEAAQVKKRKKEEKAQEMKAKTVKRCLKQSLSVNKKKTKINKNESTTESSDASDVEVNSLCDDDSDDELDNVDLGLKSSKLTLENKTPNELCCICGEVGRDRELWFRCIMCSSWNHAECTAVDSAKDYICDFCLDEV